MSTTAFAILCTIFSLPFFVISIMRLRNGLRLKVRKSSGEIKLFNGLGISFGPVKEITYSLNFVSSKPFVVTANYLSYRAEKIDDESYKYDLIPDPETQDIFCKNGSCTLVYNQDRYKLTRILSTGLEETVFTGSIFLSLLITLIYLLTYML